MRGLLSESGFFMCAHFLLFFSFPNWSFDIFFYRQRYDELHVNESSYPFHISLSIFYGFLSVASEPFLMPTLNLWPLLFVEALEMFVSIRRPC